MLALAPSLSLSILHPVYTNTLLEGLESQDSKTQIINSSQRPPDHHETLPNHDAQELHFLKPVLAPSTRLVPILLM